MTLGADGQASDGEDEARGSGEDTQRIEGLIEGSSFGTDGARQLRARADTGTVDAILRPVADSDGEARSWVVLAEALVLFALLLIHLSGLVSL